VRLVRAMDGTVVVDLRRRMVGRGAWICANESCVERGVRRDRLAHAFRKPCGVPPGLDAAILAAAAERRDSFAARSVGGLGGAPRAPHVS